MIDHLELHRDEALMQQAAAALNAIGSVGSPASEMIRHRLSAYTIQARDSAFGTVVTMNLAGELTAIELPPLYADQIEDAWDRASTSITRTVEALQVRAQQISAKATFAGLGAGGVSGER